MEKAVDKHQNLPEAFFYAAEYYSDSTVYSQAIIEAGDTGSQPRNWEGRSFLEVKERVLKIAAYLKALGCSKGDKIAILSYTRPEWMEADLAILSVGAVSISVYQSLPEDDVGYILYDSDTEIVFAENQEQVDKLIDLLSKECNIPATEEREATKARISLRKIITFENTSAHELIVPLSEILNTSEATEIDVSDIKADDLAALVYTSGTTGPPKGVMQTHANHLANVRQVIDSKLVVDGTKIMLFLPLAHSFAKLMGYIGFLTKPSLCFPGIPDKTSSKLDPKSVTQDIREANSTVIPIVPRLLEKMQAGIQQKAAAGGIGGIILRTTLTAAKAIYDDKNTGKPASGIERFLYSLTAGLRKKIIAKLFGPSFNYAVSGGAKLNPDTAHFFAMLGIEILEGYGLTETCVATNVNHTGKVKIGTVGPRLADDIELKIASDGEILFRGPNVTSGYYNRETATRESWDSEGWFHTGDLGSLDEQGYLTIEGRKKEILVTSYGKNIAPEHIEQRLKGASLISQAVLIGDGRAYCVAVLTLDEEAVKAWSSKSGNGHPEDRSAGSKLYEDVWSQVEDINAELASYETVKKIFISPYEFTVDNGFLTPTFKVKRRVVLDNFKSEIDSLYAE